MSGKPLPDSPTADPRNFDQAGALARFIGTLGRVIALIAYVAMVWTVAQWGLAREENVVGLWLPATIVYAAGIGYLLLTAVASWRATQTVIDNPPRSRIGSLALVTAHAIVVAAALFVAWRGIAARTQLVGLGMAVVSWSVVGVLAIGLEMALALVAGRLFVASPGANNSSRGARLAPACLACAVAIGLSMAYLESRSLPNSPGERPIDSQSAREREKSATHRQQQS